jgi:hypothetical protein
MRELLNLAATMIEASGATERRRSAANAMLVMVATTAAGLCAVGTVICLLAALWVYEMPLLGDAGAPLVVAAVLAAATVIAWLVMRAKTTPPPPDPPGIGTLLLNGGLHSLMRSNKLLVLLGALIIGMAAAEGSERNR